MLDFSRSSKYGVIDNNLLDFYNTKQPNSQVMQEEKHGEGVVDVLKKLKEPAKKLAKEIIKGAAKAGAQELGSFALRKIVDKVTEKKPISKEAKPPGAELDEEDFIEEEDINAKIRKKVLKDLQILPIKSSADKVSEAKPPGAKLKTKSLENISPEKKIESIKNLLDEELKKILNITTPETQFPGAKLPKIIPNLRIGE